MNKEFFKQVFKDELEIEHREHPPSSVLLGYVLQELGGDEERRVGVHIATCAQCSAHAEKLREKVRALDEHLRALPDPLECYPLKEQKPGLFAWVKRRIEEDVGTLMGKPASGRGLLIHLGAYATAGVLLFSLNLVLDRLLVPPPSPLGSPIEINRWWVQLYWLLLPWGLFLGWQVVRLRRKGSEKLEGKESRDEKRD